MNYRELFAWFVLALLVYVSQIVAFSIGYIHFQHWYWGALTLSAFNAVVSFQLSSFFGEKQ